MSAPAALRPMTTEELLAMPDDGMERELIRGELWERPMTVRNRWHTRIESKLAYLLWDWLLRQPEPRGAIHSGEVGCILRHDPDTTVGIDVVFISATTAVQEPDHTTLIDGVPILAAEILSPSEKQEEIDVRVNEYLTAGTPLVWVINPRFRTVTVYRPDREPELFNIHQELTAEPHMPGLRIRVAEIFPY